MLITPPNHSPKAGAETAPERTSENSAKADHSISDSLQGWKEIAAYMKRGIRTVQRWEKSGGLPVRRPVPGDRSPVFAFPDELEVWVKRRKGRRNGRAS